MTCLSLFCQGKQERKEVMAPKNPKMEKQNDEDAEHLREQWRMVASVLDRLFLLIFLVFSILLAYVMLYIMPQWDKKLIGKWQKLEQTWIDM